MSKGKLTDGENRADVSPEKHHFLDVTGSEITQLKCMKVACSESTEFSVI
jgi:hypothetical protein